MKFRAVLVLPLDKQDNSDNRYIDPDGVTFDAEMDYPIFREFSYNDLPVGHGRISRTEDGSLIVDGELDAKVADKLAIGVSTVETVRHKNRMDIPRSEVFAIGITDHHADRNQPPVESTVDWETTIMPSRGVLRPMLRLFCCPYYPFARKLGDFHALTEVPITGL